MGIVHGFFLYGERAVQFAIWLWTSENWLQVSAFKSPKKYGSADTVLV